MTPLRYSHVIFYHIPKCAGTTVKNALGELFPEESQYKVGFTPRDTGTFNDYIALSEQERAQYAFVHGHMVNRLLECAPADSFAFAFFRNPLDRVVSLYNYYLRSDALEYYALIKQNSWDLESFVASGCCLHVDNGMTRLLSDRFNVPFGECEPSMLSAAIRNLDGSFAFLGIQERFREGMFLLLKLLGAAPKPFASHNVTKRKVTGSRPEAGERLTIERYNQLDIHLYRHVRERYMERFRPLCDEYAQEYRSYLQAWAPSD